MKSLTVACVQHACGNDRSRNWARSEQGITEAARRGARLVLLPELHGSGYFPLCQDRRYFDKSEPIPGPTTDWLGQLARQTQTLIVGSVFERRGVGVYHNTAVVLERDGSLAGCYRKMHIPDDPGYNEKYYFTPGESFAPIQTSVGRLGVLVCWDQWFPEAARLMALAGADLLLYPTAIGWDANDSAPEKALQLASWQTVQRGHAVANLIPVMVANRIGEERQRNVEANFWGNSFISGPRGEVLAGGGQDEAVVLCAELDLEQTRDLRRSWPFFRDRRIDAYQGLIQRTLTRITEPVTGYQPAGEIE